MSELSKFIGYILLFWTVISAIFMVGLLFIAYYICKDAKTNEAERGQKNG